MRQGGAARGRQVQSEAKFRSERLRGSKRGTKREGYRGCTSEAESRVEEAAAESDPVAENQNVRD